MQRVPLHRGGGARYGTQTDSDGGKDSKDTSDGDDGGDDGCAARGLLSPEASTTVVFDLAGHAGRVTSAVFHSPGLLCTASADNTARLWFLGAARSSGGGGGGEGGGAAAGGGGGGGHDAGSVPYRVLQGGHDASLTWWGLRYPKCHAQTLEKVPKIPPKYPNAYARMLAKVPKMPPKWVPPCIGLVPTPRCALSPPVSHGSGGGLLATVGHVECS
jgi:hypothetical protein